MNFDKQKQLVLKYYDELEDANADNIGDVLQVRTAADWRWYGFSPCDERVGAKEVAEAFWQPFLYAMSSVQRRQDIFFAGTNQIDNFQSTWVVSMGHLVGLFDQPLWGIPPTQKMTFFRYCEFNKVVGDKIVETAFFFDIPHLMVQAGLNPFPHHSQRGANIIQPGPQTHDGLYYTPQAPEQGEKTLDIINSMIKDLGQWDSNLTLEDELRQSWHNNMIWWGPTGIGSTYTIERYAKQHSAPFRAAFCERSSTQHICRLSEGNYGGFFGWPNFTARLRQEFIGIPPTKNRGEFRVIDIYRRQDDKLAENWVFIDLIHWAKHMGYDILNLA
jgi:predicted ester cyclase